MRRPLSGRTGAVLARQAGRAGTAPGSVTSVVERPSDRPPAARWQPRPMEWIVKCRLIRVLLLAALSLVSFGGGMWARPVDAQQAPRARLEPTRGAYFGVNLNWGADGAQAFNGRLGARA